MKRSREILGIAASLLLLALFIISWLRGVYHRELEGLKAEANVVFFNALEEANDRLFISKRMHHDIFHSERNAWVHENNPPDTNTRRVLVFEAQSEIEDTLLESKTVEIITSLKRMLDTAENISLAINATARHTMSFDIDSSVIIDFNTTRENLASLLDSTSGQSSLTKLQFRVVENPDSDSIFEGAFLTKEGSLGNLFLGTNEYAAVVENYEGTVFDRMIDEFILGIFLFIAIASAFIFIYRSLIKERNLASLKDDFISNITHEFKTPISVVHVALEALKDFNVMNDQEKANEYLELSKSELYKLTGMVDQIMNLSKLENPQVISHFESVDLCDVISTTIDNLNIGIERKNQTLRFQNSDCPNIINGDPRSIQSVFYNLIDNANKYGANGGKIDIGVFQENGSAVVQISNDGPVIPDEYKNRIFEKFFRIPSANVHDVKGYGLGLHYTKSLVEQHGGTIDLESKNGLTRFKICFPLQTKAQV